MSHIVIVNQSKMSKIANECEVEMVISIVTKPVFILYFGHFILFSCHSS